MIIKNKSGDVLADTDASVLSRDLSNRDLHAAMFESLTMEGIVFDQSSLIGARFERCNLYWACFFEADLSGAEFVSTDLRGADFSQAICVATRFDTCNLGPDNMGGFTSFRGANLSGATFRECCLQDAVYDISTQFPPSFDPRRAGMQQVSRIQ